MQISKEQLAQLISLARADAPRETCGLLGGKDGQVLRVYPLRNVDPLPNVRYLGDPQQQLSALRDIEESGWDVVAIYHSHPSSDAYPSPTDIARAFYPEAVYVLISLMQPAQAILRAFQIQEGKVREVTLDVGEKQDEPSGTRSRRTARRTH